MTEPRIPLITEPSDEVAQILEGALTQGGVPLNIFGALAHHPKLMKRFNLMGGFLLNKGVLPAREREIVILRVGWNSQAVYEFGQHTVIGKDCGLTDDEIRGLAGYPHDFSSADCHLIALADELCADNVVSDETWTNLASRWSETELVELLICAGFYRLVSGFLNSVKVPLEPGVPGWPEPR